MKLDSFWNPSKARRHCCEDTTMLRYCFLCWMNAQRTNLLTKDPLWAHAWLIIPIDNRSINWLGFCPWNLSRPCVYWGKKLRRQYGHGHAHKCKCIFLISLWVVMIRLRTVIASLKPTKEILTRSRFREFAYLSYSNNFSDPVPWRVWITDGFRCRCCLRTISAGPSARRSRPRMWRSLLLTGLFGVAFDLTG